jgi:HK97 family phage major capsid protein
MAVTEPIDISRKTTGIDLTPETQAQIWQDVAYQSALLQLVPNIALPGAGLRIPIIEGDLEADWVAETAVKPKSKVTFDKKDMAGYTVAVIIPFSNQFRRDKQSLYNAVVARAPGAIAKKIDRTVLGADTKPGDLFDQLTDAPKIALGSQVWKKLNAADDSVTDNDGEITGWALSPHGRSILRQSTDNNGRPLFLNGTTGADVSTILGNPVYVSKGAGIPGKDADGTNPAVPEVVGIAGEFTSATFGTVEGLSMSISDQSTITLDGEPVNLWERNMFAVRVELEIGFRLRDVNRFVLLTV